MTGEELIFGIYEGTVGRFLPACDFQQIKDVTMEEFKGLYPTAKNANRRVVSGYDIAIGKV